MTLLDQLQEASDQQLKDQPFNNVRRLLNLLSLAAEEARYGWQLEIIHNQTKRLRQLHNITEVL